MDRALFLFNFKNAVDPNDLSEKTE